MILTQKIKLLPTFEQEVILKRVADECVSLINNVVEYQAGQLEVLSALSKSEIRTWLDNNTREYCVNRACNIYQNHLEAIKKSNSCENGYISHLPHLKRPYIFCRKNQYTIRKNYIEFSDITSDNSEKLRVRCIMTDEIYNLIKDNLKSLRIFWKNNKVLAAFFVVINEPACHTGQVMGVDLGIKVPAVCYTDSGKVKFVGSGREIRCIKRHFQKMRSKSKASVSEVIGKKETQRLTDIDHKISRQIVDFAIQNGVSTICLEDLKYIRENRRQNNKQFRLWPFRRLTGLIEYKAKLAGIKVEKVNPAYTSQICPVCGKHNLTKSRKYSCECGYRSHRDIVGAINICRSAKVFGKRTPS